MHKLKALFALLFGLAMQLSIGTAQAAVPFTPGDYYVLDLTDGSVLSVTNVSDAARFNTDLYKRDRIAFRKVVSDSAHYAVSVFPITQAQYTKIASSSWVSGVSALPAQDFGSGDTKPAHFMSLNTFKSLATKISAAISSSRTKVTVQRSSEWATIAKAGTTTLWFFGSSSADLGSYAWYGEQNLAAHEVGGKLPNQWGFYDVYGNLAELCDDHDTYNTSAIVTRGGASNSDPDLCSSTIISIADNENTGYSWTTRLVLKPTSGQKFPTTLPLESDHDAIPEPDGAFVPGDYYVLDLTDGTVHQTTNVSDPTRFNTNLYKTDRIAFRRISAGSFTMQAQSGESGSLPLDVEIPSDYAIAVFPLTQAQYARINTLVPDHGATPDAQTFGLGDLKPEHYISLTDCRMIATALSTKLSSSGFGLTMAVPNEAEWECAARAGTKTKWFFGNDSAGLDDYAWYNEPVDATSVHDVGGKRPNQWGLYDVYGNVWECCSDISQPWMNLGTGGYYNQLGGWGSNDPSAYSRFTHIFRGGAAYSSADYCSSTYRGEADRDYARYIRGVRLVLRPASGTSLPSNFPIEEEVADTTFQPGDYYVLDLSSDTPQLRQATDVTDAAVFNTELYKTTRIAFRKIDGRHAVAIFPLTQRQYTQFKTTYLNGNDSVHQLNGYWKQEWGEGDLKPVHCLTYNDFTTAANAFSSVLSTLKVTVSLPNGTEWESAARAGSSTEWFFGNGADNLGLYAWYKDNTNGWGEVLDVGGKAPNPWGLYDVYGNVRELCDDPDPDQPNNIFARGGGSDSDASKCSSDSRESVEMDEQYNYGVRLVLRPKETAFPTDLADEMAEPEPESDMAFKPGDYYVLDLEDGTLRQATNVTDAAVFNTNLYKTTRIAFRKIPADSFNMQEGQEPNPYAVSLNVYAMAVFPLTQGQYEKLRERIPEIAALQPQNFGAGELKSAHFLSYDDGVDLTGKVSSWISSRGVSVMLPNEAEWECAARAGSHTKWFFGTTADDLGDYAWFNDGGGTVHPVGEKLPNQWGLYDVYGGVVEWCSDVYDETWNNVREAQPGGLSGNSNKRIRRGGMVTKSADYCSSTDRREWNYSNDRYISGFRLVLKPTGGNFPTDLPDENLRGDDPDVPPAPPTPTDPYEDWTEWTDWDDSPREASDAEAQRLLSLNFDVSAIWSLRHESCIVSNGVLVVKVRLSREVGGQSVSGPCNGRLRLMGAPMCEGVYRELFDAEVENADFSAGDVATIRYLVPRANRPFAFRAAIGDASFVPGRYAALATNEYAWLRGQQLSNGAIAKINDAATVTVNPYFSLEAVIGLLRGHPTQESRRMAERYFDWHFAHLNIADTAHNVATNNYNNPAEGGEPAWYEAVGAPGTYYDYAGFDGTIYDYSVSLSGVGGAVVSECPVDTEIKFLKHGDGINEKKHPLYDSVDSYAALLFVAMADYARTPIGADYARAHSNELARVWNALCAAFDPSGFTHARLDYYDSQFLMDNCEVYKGLVAARTLFGETLGDVARAEEAETRLSVMDARFRSAFVDGDHLRTAAAETTFCWANFYPDATAQLFPVTYGLFAPGDDLAQNLHTNVCRHFQWWKPDNWRDPFVWTVVSLYGAKMRDARTYRYVDAYAGYAATDHSYGNGFHCAEAGMLLTAFGDERHFFTTTNAPVVFAEGNPLTPLWTLDERLMEKAEITFMRDESVGRVTNSLIRLREDVEGPVRISDDLGIVTLDLNGHRLVGADGLSGTADAPNGGAGSSAFEFVAGSGLSDPTAETARPTLGGALPHDGQPMSMDFIPGDYLVVDLANGGVTEFPASADQTSNTFNTAAFKDSKIAFRRIPAGTALLQTGTHDTPAGAEVTFMEDYWIAIFPLTVGQCGRLYPQMPNQDYARDNVNECPAHLMSWTQFGEAFSNLDARVASFGYRAAMANEAQWERALRAGSTNTFFCGEAERYYRYGLLKPYAWTHTGNDGLMNVGLKLPNRWGLFDMLGNTWEWCIDYQWSFLARCQPGGPLYPFNVIDADRRVTRGGSILQAAQDIDAFGSSFFSSSSRNNELKDTRHGYIGSRPVLMRQARTAVAFPSATDLTVTDRTGGGRLAGGNGGNGDAPGEGAEILPPVVPDDVRSDVSLRWDGAVSTGNGVRGRPVMGAVEGLAVTGLSVADDAVDLTVDVTFKSDYSTAFETWLADARGMGYDFWVVTGSSLGFWNATNTPAAVDGRSPHGTVTPVNLRVKRGSAEKAGFYKVEISRGTSMK